MKLVKFRTAVFLFFLLLVLTPLTSNAQVVRVIVNVPPPYPIHLEDYMGFSNQTIITLSNLSNETQQLKLLTSITGSSSGISAVVKPNYLPSIPIILGPMEVKILTGAQLKAINSNLGENDIQIQGISLEQIIQTEVLPEDNYQVCVQAFDYQNNTPLSAPDFGCANVWITHYDPPEIILPDMDASVPSSTPQFVNFVWTPSGIGAYTRYRFEMVDMNLNNLQNINDAFGNIAVQLHYRQDNIFTSSFQYNISMPPLKKGHRYAIRVTAYDPTDHISFKNEGKSPVSAFLYTDAGLAGIANNDGPLGPQDFVDNPPPDNDPDIPNDPNNPVDPDYADPCSPLACSPAPANGNAVNTWKIGDEIMVGYFKMKLTATVWNGNNLSGSGEIESPFFNSWIKVSFQNLKVNANGQVLGVGKVNADYDNGANIDPKLKNFAGGLAGISGNSVSNVSSFVQSGQKIVELFGGETVKLPFAFKTNVGGQQQLINITAIEFTTAGARFNAFMHLELPEANNQKLALGAKDICFHPTGMTEGGLQKLYLVEDFTYNFGPKINLTLKAENGDDSGTFAKWDCEGYEEIQVEGEFEFQSSLLVPENGNGKVKANFLMNAPSWGDLIATVDFDPFRVKGTKGLKFDFDEVILDFSDVNNINNMVFPANYQGDQSDTWKGFYFSQLNITLPDYLKKNGQKVSIQMTDALIDKLGFSGKVKAQPVIAIDDGTVGGWAFSLDILELEFINNSMTGSYFDGKVQLPVADTGLGYHCLLNNSNQDLETEFQISNLNDLNVPMWVADLNLLEGSSLTISAQGNDVTMEANLSGGLTMNGQFPDFENLEIDFPDIAFEALKIRNKQPYLSCTTFSLASPQKSFNGFNISIDPDKEGEGISLSIDENNNTATINIGFSVALHSKGTGISGLTNFSIIGKMIQQQGKQKWVYDKAQLNKIVISATLSALQIDGEIEFYSGDGTFGKGFRGQIHAVFSPFIDVTATAQFGKVDGYRYWFVDAKAIFQPGITIGPAVAIYGFGGGAYYHMKPASMPPISDINTNQANNTQAFNLDTAGQSNSGVKYLPDDNIAFGFKASIVFGVQPDPTPFNCDIEIEANFNTNGGLNYIRFTGNGYFMTKVTEHDNPKVFVGIDLQYWHPEKKFHGVCNFEMDFADVLTGTGEIVIHSEPGTWYFLAGTPDDRLSIKIFNALKVGTYFMMGNQIPGPPSIPGKFIGKPNLEGFELSRVINQDAAGFAFGQHFEFDTGKLKFLIFYAKMAIELGYDVALLKGTQCDQVANPGINNWYGTGFAYAGFEFECGIDIDLWFLKTEIEIFSAYLYAAIEVGLPNPTWTRGWVSGEYSVLNGLLKGSFNFNFKAGTICEPPGTNNPFGGLEIISDFSPDGQQGDVFVTAEVAFALPLDSEIPIQEVTEDNTSKTHLFKFYLEDIVLKRVGKKQGENIIAITPELVEGSFNTVQKKLAQFTPNNGLEPFSVYEITARVYGKRKIDGWWKYITKSKNNPDTYYEVKKHKFITGAQPDVFTNNNIKVTYPRRMHRYFHKNDVQNGVINFKTDIKYIFEIETQNPQFWKYKFVVKFHKIKGGAAEVAEVPMHYNQVTKSVSFEVPYNLDKESIYMAQFVAKLVKNPQGWIVDNNNNKLSTIEVTSNLGTGNTTTVQQTQINSTETGGGEHELYKFFFRTSKYGSFKYKWDKYQNIDKYTDENEDFEHRINLEQKGDEPLDYFDVNTSGYKIGSVTYYNEPLVGLFNRSYDSEPISGFVGKAYIFYRRHLHYWLDTNYDHYVTEIPRYIPHYSEYGINSRNLYGKSIDKMEKYAIGLKYIGNGKHHKLTMNEINKAYWQGLNQNPEPNNVNPQVNNDIVLPPNQGHPNNNLNLQMAPNQDQPNGLNLQMAPNQGNGNGMIGNVNLQANVNDGGNNGGGGSPMGGMGMNFSEAPDYRALLIYDHLHVSYYDREIMYDALTSMPMGGGVWLNHGAMWEKFVNIDYYNDFLPKKSSNSTYSYKWFTNHPRGVLKKGNLNERETSFKYD